MEAKEYIRIIKSNLKLLFTTIIVIVIAVFLYFSLQPERYDVSLIINITRSGMQETGEYRYDSFYRLQADQMFGDTLVEWVKSPRFEADIISDARKLSAERMTSQFVEINFFAASKKAAEKISASMVEVLERYAQNLNENQREINWFQIQAAKPVIEKYTPDYFKIVVASLLIGIFLGFWLVMGKYYFEKS